MLVFNPTIDLGQLATIAIALSGGIWFASRTLASVQSIKSDMTRVEQTLRSQADELKKLTELFVWKAAHDARLSVVEAEVARLREAREQAIERAAAGS